MKRQDLTIEPGVYTDKDFDKANYIRKTVFFRNDKKSKGCLYKLSGNSHGEYNLIGTVIDDKHYQVDIPYVYVVITIHPNGLFAIGRMQQNMDTTNSDKTFDIIAYREGKAFILNTFVCSDMFTETRMIIFNDDTFFAGSTNYCDMIGCIIKPKTYNCSVKNEIRSLSFFNMSDNDTIIYPENDLMWSLVNEGTIIYKNLKKLGCLKNLNITQLSHIKDNLYSFASDDKHIGHIEINKNSVRLIDKDPLKYDYIKRKDNFYIVTKDDDNGILNLDFKLIIPIKYNYYSLQTHGNFIKLTENNLSYIIDNKGRYMFVTNKYDWYYIRKANEGVDLFIIDN